MQVTIHGPNLNDQSKGSFHVHSADCRDNDREVKQNGSDLPMTIEALSVEEVVRYVYGDQIREGASVESCEADFYFEPCCAGIGANGSAEVETRTCTYKDHEGPREISVDHFPRRGNGKFVGWCRDCQTKHGRVYRARKARAAQDSGPAEPQVPLAHRLPASVVRTLDGDGYRYDAILADGTVLELRRAAKVYTHASAYAQVRYEPGQEPEAPVVYLHGREDLARRGDPQTNLAIRQGVSYFVRIPGVVAIVEA